MSNNKLVKTWTLTGLAAGIIWIVKKVVKEDFTADPMNYAQFNSVMAGNIALKQYLEHQKILPTYVIRILS